MSSHGNIKRPGIEETLAWLKEQSHDVVQQATRPTQRSALSAHLDRLVGLTYRGVADHSVAGEQETTSVSDLIAILNRLSTKTG